MKRDWCRSDDVPPGSLNSPAPVSEPAASGEELIPDGQAGWIERQGMPDLSASAEGDGTEQLCRAVFGRKATARDYVGGSDAPMLYAAAAMIRHLTTTGQGAEIDLGDGGRLLNATVRGDVMVKAKRPDQVSGCCFIGRGTVQDWGIKQLGPAPPAFVQSLRALADGRAEVITLRAADARALLRDRELFQPSALADYGEATAPFGQQQEGQE